MAENKKTLTVTQQVKELVYDIQNKAYLTGQAREAEGKKNYEAASNMPVSYTHLDVYKRQRLCEREQCIFELEHELRGAAEILLVKLIGDSI